MKKHRFDSSRLSWTTEPRSLIVSNDKESILTVRRTGGTDRGDISDDSSSSQKQGHVGDSNEAHPCIQTQKDEASNVSSPTTWFTFEKDLRASRPYIRALKRYSVHTATSSVAPSMGWSFFSGLSLAEVSCLSAIGLPIAPQDLWNGTRYRVANSSPHNHLEQPRVMSERLLRSMARNLATSIATVTDLNDYKFSSADDFGVERRPPDGLNRLALFGIFPDLSTTIEGI